MMKNKQEIQNPEEIREILSRSMICRLAMADGEYPYVLPFNYGYQDNSLYIHSALEGRKVGILKNNPKVSFEVEDRVEVIPAEKACGWATRYRSVIGRGKAELIYNHEEKVRALDIIMRQHGSMGKNEYKESSLKAMLIIRVRIEEMSGKRSSNWFQSTES